MKRYFIISIAVAALLAGTMPVGAETVFNQSSKCIQNWGKGCGGCSSAKAAAPAPAKNKKCCCKKTDALGNTTPCCTSNSGKVKLGM